MPSSDTSYATAAASAAQRLGDWLACRLPGGVMPLAWRAARFLAVGLVGLAVDASLFSLLYGQGASAAWGRAASLGCATLVTWALNRLVTFSRSGRAALIEALRYGTVALLAQGFNYGSFLLLLAWTGHTHPLRVLVASAAMTAGLSFTGQSLFAFRRADAPPVHFRR